MAFLFNEAPQEEIMMCNKSCPYALRCSRRVNFVIGYWLEHMWICVLFSVHSAVSLYTWSFFFFSNHVVCLVFLYQDALIESSSDEDESSLEDEKKSRSVVDMEDLGNIMNSVKKAKVRLQPHCTLMHKPISHTQHPSHLVTNLTNEDLQPSCHLSLASENHFCTKSHRNKSIHMHLFWMCSTHLPASSLQFWGSSVVVQQVYFQFSLQTGAAAAFSFFHSLSLLSKEKKRCVTEGEMADGLVDTRPRQARSGGLRNSEDAHITDLWGMSDSRKAGKKEKEETWAVVEGPRQYLQAEGVYFVCVCYTFKKQ